jgi:nitroreductase
MTFCQSEHGFVASVLARRTIGAMTAEFEQFSALVRRRRTNMRVDPDRAVDVELVSSLCDVATWAPNHKMTEPWRFAVVTGAARADLGRLTAEHMSSMGETNEAKLDKTRGKYVRTPVVLVVACESTQPGRQTEDRDAVAAAVQNILLGATAAGLNSYWGTGAICHAPEVKTLCGFPPEADIIAAIYLGWSIGDVPTPTRTPPQVRWVS